jgi:hypothetical protein
MVRGSGHPSIRATHVKTLEISRELHATERGTCIVAVGAEFDAEALGLLRGMVKVTMRAAGFEVSGEAVINPDHRVGDRLVIRRSRFMNDDTLAVGATLTANALNAELVSALQDPATEVTVTIEEEGPLAPLVLIGEPRDGRRKLLWEHADHTVDLASVRDLPERPHGTIAATLSQPLDALLGTAVQWLTGMAESGARIAITEPGHQALESLFAAGFPAEPALRLGRARPGLEQVLQAATVPTVLTITSAEASLLDRLERAIAVPDGALEVGTAMTWVDPGKVETALRDCPGTDVTVVVPPRVGGELIDLAVTVRALVGAGVAPRTISEALRPLGVTRRKIYDITG